MAKSKTKKKVNDTISDVWIVEGNALATTPEQSLEHTIELNTKLKKMHSENFKRVLEGMYKGLLLGARRMRETIDKPCDKFFDEETRISELLNIISNIESNNLNSLKSAIDYGNKVRESLNKIDVLVEHCPNAKKYYEDALERLK